MWSSQPWSASASKPSSALCSVLCSALCSVLCSALLGAPSLLSPSLVNAAPPALRDVSQIDRLPEVEKSVSLLTRTYLDPALRTRANRFVVKLTEGRVKYLSEDYRGAAMVLLELVETYTQDKSSLLYKEALFYLADSLYHIGNLKTAGKLFEELLSRGASSARVCALGRLVEVSLELKQPQLAARYQSEARRAVSEQPDPNILYQLAKYSYERGAFEEAQALWAGIKRGASVYPQARFFIATADIRRGRLKEALDGFERVRTLDLEALRREREELRGDRTLSLGELEAQRQSLQREREPTTPRCTFRSSQEQSADEKGWQQVIDEAELAVARLYYEDNMLEEATDAYLDIRRTSSAFKQAIEESVWVAIKQGLFKQALQRLDVQLIDEPEMLNNPSTRLLQGRLLSTLGRFSDAQSLFQELRERFELLKARDIAPILRRAQGQLSQYFQARLREGNLALNLEALIPREALHFARGQLSSSAARSLFVELAALKHDVEMSKEDLKLLRWVLDAPNRSEIYPQLHEGLLKALELRATLLTIQRQLNERAMAGISNPELKALHEATLSAHRALEGVPTSSLGLQEREAKVERELLKADLGLYRLKVALRGYASQLSALKLYLKDSRPDVVGGGAMSPRERAAALKQLTEEVKVNEQLSARAQALSDELQRQQLRVGLYDEPFKLDEALRETLVRALQAESEWLVTHQKMSPELMSSLERQHKVISDFQRRSLELVQGNSQELKEQLAREEKKIADQERRLQILSQRAHQLGGQIAASAFYRVLDEINAFLLEADAGLLDVAWSKKSQRSEGLSDELERRRVHLKVIQRDLADAPR